MTISFCCYIKHFNDYVIISSSVTMRRNSYKRFWHTMKECITWTPGLLNNRFSSPKSKDIYKDFQYTLYSSMLMKVLVGNVLFHFFHVIYNVFFYHTTSNTLKMSYYIAPTIGITFHVVAITLLHFQPKGFRKIYLVLIICSVLLIQLVGKRPPYSVTCGILINTCSTILYLLVATIYFQNSTVLLVLSCLTQLLSNVFSKTYLIINDSEAFRRTVSGEVCQQ